MLVAENGSVKLADFGLGSITNSQAGSITNSQAAVSAEDQLALLSEARGTTNCAAPEVFAKKDYDGSPADIWSLGEILDPSHQISNPE